MAYPIYPLSIFPPGEMEIDTPGGGIEGGRSLAGDAGAIDFSGGGLWTVKYKRISIFDSAKHRYWNYLRAILNSRTRSIIVPILTDWIAPTPTSMDGGGALYFTGIPHSDGSFFDDGSGYSQSTINAEVYADAALNAGTIQIRVIAGGELLGGEIGSILHTTKSHRAYTITDIDSVEDGDSGSIIYTVGISPPLREATVAGELFRFDRPRCLMRLAPGATLPWTVGGYWYSTPDIAFIESFI